jgi:hypothetical protein
MGSEKLRGSFLSEIGLYLRGSATQSRLSDSEANSGQIITRARTPFEKSIFRGPSPHIRRSAHVDISVDVILLLFMIVSESLLNLVGCGELPRLQDGIDSRAPRRLALIYTMVGPCATALVFNVPAIEPTDLALFFSFHTIHLILRHFCVTHPRSYEV